VVEVDECVDRPELCSQIFPGDDFAGVLKQVEQELRGLFLESDGDAIASQLRRSPFYFKGPETPVLPDFGFNGHKVRLVTEECTAAFSRGVEKSLRGGGYLDAQGKISQPPGLESRVDCE
jgi:hypothetical protein